jgi:integrase
MAVTRHGKRRITVRVHGRQLETHVAANASAREIERIKSRLLVRAENDLPAPQKGTLAGDVEVYLKTLAHRPRLRKERDGHLAFWVVRFGTQARATLEPADLSAALSELRTTRSASHCNHVRIALSHLYTTLDGKRNRNPLRDVPSFEEPEPEPRALPYYLIDRILDQMTRQWGAKDDKRPQKTKARLRVIADTGLSPAQIMRVLPSDLRLADEAIYVRRRQKGKGAPGALKSLTAAGVAAWRAFVAADAFGPWSVQSANKAWRRACKLAMKHKDTTDAEANLLLHARLYDLRHSFGTLVYQLTGDLHATSELMGHRSQKTTKRYTLAAVPAHLRAATAIVNAGSASKPSAKPTDTR